VTGRADGQNGFNRFPRPLVKAVETALTLDPSDTGLKPGANETPKN
jgi:hypothetical protein